MCSVKQCAVDIVMEPTQKQQPEKKEDVVSSMLRPLRTFKDDIAAALGKGGTGIISIATSEEERRVKRRVLSERERKLQEEIEREGAKIRMLSSEIERVQEKPGQVKVEQKPKPPQQGAGHVPPPGIPPQMLRVMPKISGAEEQPEARKHAKQLAKLRAAEKRLAEAKAKLEITRQKKAAAAPLYLKPEQKKKSEIPRMLIILSISVALLGAATGIGWYVYKNFSILGTVTPDEGVPTLVPINNNAEVPHTIDTPLIETLERAVASASVPPGNLVQLYVTKETLGGRVLLSAQEFMELLSPRVPGRLTRALEATYTFGAHRREQTDPFLVVNVTFFENAFAGILEWETTMRTDLAPLFGARASGPSKRTAPATTADIIRAGKFQDQVIQNKDARVLLDQNDNIVLLYSFIDRKTLILTTNIETFIEIHGRMTSGRVVR